MHYCPFCPAVFTPDARAQFLEHINHLHERWPANFMPANPAPLIFRTCPTCNVVFTVYLNFIEHVNRGCNASTNWMEPPER